MRASLIVALGVVVAGCAGPASTSWGKADVPMADYLADAAACAGAAAGVRAEPEPLLQASVNAGYARVGKSGSDDSARESYDALLSQANRVKDAQVRADQRARMRAHDACLAERGYVRFRLTPEQEAELSSLAEGSRERRAYLHRLGSDPAVLAAQRL